MAHYAPKVAKSEAPDKSPYTIYYPHSTSMSKRIWTDPFLQFISIDPGVKNLAIRIERRYLDSRLIEAYVYNKFAPFEVVTENDESINHLYKNINNILNNYKKYFNTTHYIIIEKQLPINYQATRVAQHIISYFINHLTDAPLLPSIVEIDPKLKGKLLKAPKGLNKKELKVWAVKHARELMLKRDDKYSLTIFDKTKKKDDLADTLCQIEAICVLWKLPLTTHQIVKNKIVLNITK
jgi:hypothetical protein